ncbi:hypothetical protein [Streptomyces mirabilis]|uniref:hypothetical protein n=1 Tax=Streptomyces mirabilis TaxID=68239 RepID=UPI0022540F6D|nr:hypothetical protein [Streptomyces mirabilis]MCX4430652.1 hypothetical protein [Streptomyces mirabilis]
MTRTTQLTSGSGLRVTSRSDDCLILPLGRGRSTRIGSQRSNSIRFPSEIHVASTRGDLIGSHRCYRFAHSARIFFSAAAATLGILGLTAPQVAAADRPIPSISAKADKNARAIAAENPAAVVAAATVCGTGYNLYKAEQLPDASRLGTLFVYVKGSNPASNDAPTCAIFDNNTSGAKWMKLKLCSNCTAEGCASDEGNFSQYAGPVYRAHGGCGTVTALMKNTSSSSTYLVNAVRDSTNCN